MIKSSLSIALFLSFLTPTLSNSQNWSDQFLIGGLGVGDLNNHQNLILMDQANIDYIINYDKGDISEARTLYQTLIEFNRNTAMDLHAIIHLEGWPNPLPGRFWKNLNVTENTNDIRSQLQKFDNDFIQGFFIWDEPCTHEEFSSIFSMTNIIKSMYPEKLAYVNLFPLYATKESPCFMENVGETLQAYNRHLETFFDRLDLVSIDYYPFTQNGMRQDFFQNLNLMRQHAQRTSKPWWLIIQASGSPAFNLVAPSLAQIKFQATSALAYGAQGFSYYTAVPTKALETEESLLHADASPTKMYPNLQSFNSSIHNLGNVLVSCSLMHVVHFQDVRNEIAPDNQTGELGIQIPLNTLPINIDIDNTPINSLIEGESRSLLVSIFKDNQSAYNYYLIVNKDTNSEHSFTFHLNRAMTITEVYSTDKQKILELDSNSFKTGQIAPGDGRLFLLETR